MQRRLHVRPRVRIGFEFWVWGFGFWVGLIRLDSLTPSLPHSLTPLALHSSVYLSDRPRAFSTGYFFALAASLASMAAARSMPVTFANSSA